MKRVVIDNKAMRRIRNQEVQLVIENATIGSAGAANNSLQVRTLFGS